MMSDLSFLHPSPPLACSPPLRPSSMFGLLAFSAPYLPWVLMGFSFIVGHDVTNDLLGIAVGHIYYFLADVYPKLAEVRGWRIQKLMYTPFFVHWLFGSCNAGGAPRGGPQVINIQMAQQQQPQQNAEGGGGVGGGDAPQGAAPEQAPAAAAGPQ
jgi:hypothetical protein